MTFEIYVHSFGFARKVVIFAESRADALRHADRIKGSRVVAVVRCTGDAHRPEVGGMIDNCYQCAPRWGWRVVRRDPPCCASTDSDQRNAARDLMDDRTPRVVTLRNGTTHLAQPLGAAFALACRHATQVPAGGLVVSDIGRSIGCLRCRRIRTAYRDAARQLSLPMVSA